MHIDYSNVTVSHAIENNLHKQQYIIGLARPRKYNALGKIFIYIVCKFSSPRECGLYPHTI